MSPKRHFDVGRRGSPRGGLAVRAAEAPGRRSLRRCGGVGALGFGEDAPCSRRRRSAGEADGAVLLGEHGSDNDHASDLSAGRHPGAAESDPGSGGEIELVVHGVVARHEKPGVILQGLMVAEIEQRLHHRVGHDDALSDRHHRFPAAGIDPRVGVEQGLLGLTAIQEQVVLDAVCRRADERVHDRAGLVAETADVQDPFDAAVERVANWRAGAGEGLQRLDEVLRADDVLGLPGLQDRPDTIGADRALCVAEALGEVHLVQETPDPGVAVCPAEYACSTVGQGDADRDVGDLVGQALDDRLGAAYEP